MSFSVFASNNSQSDVSLNYILFIAFDSSDNLYASNSGGNNILKFTLDGSGMIFASDTSITDSSFNFPTGLAFDTSGNLYCANNVAGNNNILKITPDGSGKIFASNTISDVSFNYPSGLAFDSSGNLYCSNTISGDNNILKITPDGSGMIFASNNITDVSFNYPSGLAFDTSGNLYCANSSLNNILKITPDGTSGMIFASNFISDVSLNGPAGLAFDNAGNLYSTNAGGNYNILKFTSDGSGTIFSFDPSLNSPYGIAFNSSEYLYVANVNDNNILKSDAASCFNKGTKILCLNDSLEEEYIPIEDLKKGDLVKTYLHGYRRIDLIGKGFFSNKPKVWYDSMYKMEKTNQNEGFEDLIVTGGHGILVDNITEEDKENYKKLGFYNEMEKIDDKYLLTVAISSQFTQITTHDFYTYYHFVPENDGDDNKRFGVWANGILTETPSKNQFTNHNYEII